MLSALLESITVPKYHIILTACGGKLSCFCGLTVCEVSIFYKVFLVLKWWTAHSQGSGPGLYFKLYVATYKNSCQTFVIPGSFLHKSHSPMMGDQLS